MVDHSEWRPAAAASPSAVKYSQWACRASTSEHLPVGECEQVSGYVERFGDDDQLRSVEPGLARETLGDLLAGVPEAFTERGPGDALGRHERSDVEHDVVLDLILGAGFNGAGCVAGDVTD